MEEIYVNVAYDNSKASQSQGGSDGPRSSEGRFHGAVVLSLALLSVFLLAALIGLGVHYHDSTTAKANLTESLQSSDKERDLLNARITQLSKELERLQNLSKQVKTCPAGWRMFSFSCYLLSNESGTWDKGREDCRKRGADLVVIDSYKEELFLTEFTKKSAWIGLNDREKEGTWKWIDGTPVTLTYWIEPQPDNGGGHPQYGEEDCAHIRTLSTGCIYWNDLSCESSLRWICEKKA